MRERRVLKRLHARLVPHRTRYGEDPTEQPALRRPKVLAVLLETDGNSALGRRRAVDLGRDRPVALPAPDAAVGEEEIREPRIDRASELAFERRRVGHELGRARRSA